MQVRRILAAAACGAAAIIGVIVAADDKPNVPVTAKVQGDLGYRDTKVLPGQKWKVHDIDRPRPRAIDPGTPGTQERAGRPPSDAIILFDGNDMSKWQWPARGWKLENGYVEVMAKGQSLQTKDSYGDMQLHVEWTVPPNPPRTGQWRGNSGIILMGRYEVQVLDSYDAATYADGQAASMYGQFPPLVNASRPPGQWQMYDIIFETPRFDGSKMTRPPVVTVLHNGVVVHNHQAFIGQMAHRVHKPFEPHGPEAPLVIQNHDVPVRYRSIWLRELGSYDHAQ
jgi:hypothetical protein